MSSNNDNANQNEINNDAFEHPFFVFRIPEIWDSWNIRAPGRQQRATLPLDDGATSPPTPP